LAEVPAMNEVARQTLRQVVADQGAAIGENPRRVEAFLRDLCGDCRAEIFVLTTAAQAGVPHDLMSSSSRLHDVTGGRLVSRLVDEFGIARDGAEWAVESWALALGVDARGEAGATPAAPPAVAPAAAPPL